MTHFYHYSNKQLLIIKYFLDHEINRRREEAIKFLQNTNNPSQCKNCYKNNPSEEYLNDDDELSNYDVITNYLMDSDLPTKREDQEEDNGFDIQTRNNIPRTAEELDEELDDIEEHIRLKIPFNKPLE